MLCNPSDDHCRTIGLIQKIKETSESSDQVRYLWICTDLDYFAPTNTTRGWGCGYRNIQMLLSSLVHVPEYSRRLFNGNYDIPSIHRLQELIEAAWANGFDPQSRREFGGKLKNTKKWIGASEVVAFFSFFRIRCNLVDFFTPAGLDNPQTELIQWLKDYFSKPENVKLPVLLQRQGHSVIVIGIEEWKDGSLRVLTFDASSSLASKCSNKEAKQKLIKQIRNTPNKFKARQYQLMFFDGIIENQIEYERRKVIASQWIK